MKRKSTPVKANSASEAGNMNLRDIEDLIKFVQSSGVAEVSIEQKDIKITIRTTHGSNQSNPVTHYIQQSPVAQNPGNQPQSQAAVAPAPEKPKSGDESKYVTIKSPMIGTFYRTPSPDKPMFVNVGDEIKPGKVLCIIEAMKLFNEIESEVSGKVVKVLVDNATPVEYDQPLFLIDPS
jgi:acetyl-CoA carboxylase biotin carboxyl carrier protein